MKNTKKNVRIDKWLWSVRLFKTRSQATAACKKNKVTINGIPVKPSYSIKIDETVELNYPLITRTFKVTDLLEKRVSAKLAVNFVEETTPAEAFEKLKSIRNNPFALRDRGAGRPTKKDRRNIEQLTFYDSMESSHNLDDWDDGDGDISEDED
ncbi:MAG: RNA-binding S4 domain-containing protein [bacterium]|nr:RNA-binding S4 domain-containing protein [bacterium]